MLDRMIETPAPNPARPVNPSRPHRVVIAGGGVAALEALLLLRELAQERVEIQLIAPSTEFVYRPLEFAALFRDEHVRRFDLRRIAADNGATVVPDRLEAVWPDAQLAVTAGGDHIEYDSLLVATGARLHTAVPGALTIAAPGFRQDFRHLIADIEAGIARRVVFAAPVGTGWLLPLYELALMTADRLRELELGAKLLFVTPEEAPLEVFGEAGSREVDRLLRERRIELMTGRAPVRSDLHGLIATPGSVIEADRVIALPAMRGPGVHGLPEMPGGFIPTDAYCRVMGHESIYAAGDGTAFPVKQGGLAAQQADAAASAIAVTAGADVEPQPFKPVLRGLLLTGHEPHYLRTDLTTGHVGETADRPLWWPDAKVAARSLAPYLAARPGLELRATT
jgi:sulfide:quinone oxidoreductase